MSNGDERIKARPTLKTERLLLRRPETGDARAIMGIVGDWEVVRRLTRVPHPYSESDAHFFLNTVVPDEWVWAITWRESREVVGTSSGC